MLCRDDALFKHFAQHATVTEVRLMTDRQGQPKGYGFAEFTSIAEASRALHALQASQNHFPLSSLQAVLSEELAVAVITFW